MGKTDPAMPCFRERYNRNQTAPSYPGPSFHMLYGQVNSFHIHIDRRSFQEAAHQTTADSQDA